MKTSFFVNAAKNIVLNDEKRKELKEKLERSENDFRRNAASQATKESFLSRSYSL